ncbi:efflux RND transporter permease subunit [Marinagarivorans cellulosilyticus]|uniref:Cu(I)/Ag(I) efflux system membrane protein CusA/SilA n=1 Tax=Marinagarivorans cellulosilyticus TaxID=2721545 RepID=A0AAN2BKU9_9GAMM|nr:efflux RND transporter permease subunit [Marinagarivorans cellulosilyticus]BCD98357.1 Cu(I)/Ag(I) efflux system membrane protein CusA/SilA [Marinagarivorans cellulosilyticus]
MNKFNPLHALIGFSLRNKAVVFLLTAGLIFWGFLVAPFDWHNDHVARSPVPVDAIPDIGENQQIVFTEWAGRSPQDIEDQIGYPLTTTLLGLPAVKTVRSYSMLGVSSIYIIFKEDVEFYWARSRILEKLNSLPAGTLPEGVQPKLGPDATALGQVFWYTLEGHDNQGAITGGWDLHELRSTQDWLVRYALQGVEGVAEVSSIGGFVKEYQIDVDPNALRTYNISLAEVFDAVRASNLDVGARTIEINAVEYVIRGLGFIKSLDDLRRTVITQRNNVPITLNQIAEIEFGPALRRGALNKEGSEAVGGVVVARHGENPLNVIQRIKEKIATISPGLPSKTLADGTVSQLNIVPFYDRTILIKETLGTLERAISQQLLITFIVVILFMLHVRSALLIAGIMPLAVLSAFIGMKLFNVDANIVALSGIAIAIGSIVDMGIVLTENIQRHLQAAPANSKRIDVIYRACTEVAGAVVTATLTTIISFLPIFTMEAAEGKLFTPLAYTKTFTLFGAIVISVILIPPLAHALLKPAFKSRYSAIISRLIWAVIALVGLGIIALNITNSSALLPLWLGIIILAFALFHAVKARLSQPHQRATTILLSLLLALVMALQLAASWHPLGVARGWENAFFVVFLLGGLMAFFAVFLRFYEAILHALLRAKSAFLAVACAIVIFGFCVGLGVNVVFSFIPASLKNTPQWQALATALPGLGKEFMPSLDEGSYLFMPTTMPHASIGEAMDILQKQNIAISNIPEVDQVVGKLGRAESPLDPAPISMIETMISFKSEYKSDVNGRILRFAYENDAFIRDSQGKLIIDDEGKPYRQWRDNIKKPDDIWQAIVQAGSLPGATSAPKLQPIAARLVMLQSGMRAPMGLKVFGPDLTSIENTALQIEALLKTVPSIQPDTVFADRIVGKPYLEIEIDRNAIARYGIKIKTVQEVIEVAIGGKPVTQTVEGRERYPVRVRYQRELRDSIESIENILVAAPDGTQVPLKELSTIHYLRGPQTIKTEGTFLVGYVLFDKSTGFAEVTTVEQARDTLNRSIANGELTLPAGVSYQFTGSYENQLRAEKKLMLIIPIALLAIALILHLQFKSLFITTIIFSAIIFAWCGGFIFIWLYSQPWFLDVTLWDKNLRDIFQMGNVNLSVAVWVGFLALFGIATDDGVLMSTYLKQHFKEQKPKTINAIRAITVQAGARRARPAIITTATTLIALLPVLTSNGRGADIMIPMGMPIFGGMVLAIMTIFIVPILFCSAAEFKLKMYARVQP